MKKITADNDNDPTKSLPGMKSYFIGILEVSIAEESLRSRVVVGPFDSHDDAESWQSALLFEMSDQWAIEPVALPARGMDPLENSSFDISGCEFVQNGIKSIWASKASEVYMPINPYSTSLDFFVAEMPRIALGRFNEVLGRDLGCISESNTPKGAS